MLHHSQQNNQPKFDIIDSAGAGYKFLFDERSYVLRLLAVPFVIKLACIIFIMWAPENTTTLWRGLILLPGHFAEGWLLAQIIRTYAFNERWPIYLSGEAGQDAVKLNSRRNCLLAGIITYVLIQMAFTAMQSQIAFSDEDIMTMQKISDGAQIDDGQTLSQGPFIFLFVSIISIVYWFPLIWLYIPATINIYLKDFYKTVLKSRLSLKLIATWILCLVPFVLVIMLTKDFMVTAFNIQPATLSQAEKILLIAIEQLFSFLSYIVATIAVTYGIKEFFQNAPIKTQPDNQNG